MMQIRKVNEKGWPPARSIAHLQNLGQEKDCSQSSYLGIWCSKEDGFPVLLHLLFGNTFPIFRFTQYSFVFLYLKRKGRVHCLPYNSLEYLASDRTAWKNTLYLRIHTFLGVIKQRVISGILEGTLWQIRFPCWWGNDEINVQITNIFRTSSAV